MYDSHTLHRIEMAIHCWETGIDVTDYRMRRQSNQQIGEQAISRRTYGEAGMFIFSKQSVSNWSKLF